MSDKELLEKAAKAYWGDEIDDVCSVRWLERDECIGYTHGDNQDHNGHDVELCWNPLEWDHDALRLAVKLNLDIEFLAEPDGVEVWVRATWSDEPASQTEEGGEDLLAATRRAIVRAAAAIGETME